MLNVPAPAPTPARASQRTSSQREPMCRGAQQHPHITSWALVELAPGHYGWRCRICYPHYANRAPAPLFTLPKAVLAPCVYPSHRPFWEYNGKGEPCGGCRVCHPSAQDIQERAERLSRSRAGAPQSTPEHQPEPESEHTQDAPASRQGTQEREHAPWLGVLDGHALWLARADSLRIERTSLAEPDAPHTLGELFALAERIGLAQLWVHPAWAHAHGLPVDGVKLRDITHRDAMGDVYQGEPDAPAFLTERGEWDIREHGMAAWYYGFRRGTYAGYSVVFPSWDTLHALWDTAADGYTLARALALYASMTGARFYRSPGTTGARLLRGLHTGPRALRLDAPAELPEPALRGGTEWDMRWLRDLDASEYGSPYINGYDKHAAYLGACSSLSLGFGEAEHIERSSAGASLVLDAKMAKLPAYWLACIDTSALDARLPNPFTPFGAESGESEPRWYTSPTLALARELGLAIELQEGYIWREHHEPLTPWARVLRTARERLSAAPEGQPEPREAEGSTEAERSARALALSLVKLTYAQFSGWLAGGFHVRSQREGREPDALWRPDWRHHIIAATRANLYRNMRSIVRQSGMYPFAGYTDCWYFASSNPDALSAAPEGMKIGPTLREYGIKYQGVPMEAIRDAIDAMRSGQLAPRRTISRVVNAISSAAGGDDITSD